MSRFILVPTLSFAVLLSACATVGGGSKLGSDLKVSSGSGRLKAKLALTNASGRELEIKNLNPADFKVQTMDGQPMSFKGKAAPIEPLKLKPGQTVETTFNLQDNYPFWDRRTKYKIWYEGAGVKSNTVTAWF